MQESKQAEHQHSHGGHGHSHGLTQGDNLRDVSDSRLLLAVVLNQLLTVVEVIAGFWSGSLALLSDAAHNFNDANALLIAYIARRISRKAADEQFTFGYRRAEVIGALVNLTLLAALGLYLVYEGIHRFVQPQQIAGGWMAAAATVALIVDLATAWMLWSMSQGSLNVRAAFLHNLVDAIGSLAVLLGAAAIIWLDWAWVDPLLTLLIAGYILWQCGTLLPQAARVLMEGAPSGLDLSAMAHELSQIEGVVELHHLHVWELDERSRALEAHVVLDEQQRATQERLKRELKHRLADDYGIAHSTLEFEFAGSEHTCNDSFIAERCGEHKPHSH